MVRSFVAANGRVLSYLLPTDCQTKVGNLDPGSRFRQDTGEASLIYGTVLEQNVASTTVALSGGQQQVVYDDKQEKFRTFVSEGRSTVRWPKEVMVQDITEDDSLWRTGWKGSGGTTPTTNAGQDPEERGILMGTNDSQAKGLQARYNLAVKKLAEATEKGDTGAIEVQQSRLTAIKEEAEQKGIELSDTPAPAPAPTKAEKLKANLSAVKGKGEKKAKGEKKEKKPKKTHDCICGCKRETLSLYAPGHDARVKGILLKVERGDLKKEDVPEGVKPFVKWAGAHGKEGFKLTAAPVKIPGRDDVENTTVKALETLDI
jgi:hypothetical protein